MRAIVFLLFIIQCYWKPSVSFTCNVGRTYEAALTSCTDGGVQKHTIGGNVSIMVHYATNLPNRDSSGPAAGVSDPYVKFTVGGYSAETKNVRNNLNPRWNELVNIGYLASATAITVEIWDKDSGLEFSDDILVRSTLRVPFCSTFMAPYDEVRCGGPFGCESDDSSWRMPRRQQCNESGAINFGRRGVDLYVTVYLVPFVMEVSACASHAHAFTTISPTLNPLFFIGFAGHARPAAQRKVPHGFRGRRCRQRAHQRTLDDRPAVRLPLPERHRHTNHRQLRLHDRACWYVLLYLTGPRYVTVATFNAVSGLLNPFMLFSAVSALLRRELTVGYKGLYPPIVTLLTNLPVLFYTSISQAA